MKFAALTLKETQDNGGAYYILFSNRPPSDKALRPSDCSAGTSIKYGTKPKSKVRNSGEFVPTWLGTTWKAGCTPHLISSGWMHLPGAIVGA